VRVLALADAPPHRPITDLVAATQPDLVVLIGDLEPAWTDGLEAVDVPKLGVHGNHDAPGALAAVGAEDVHLRRVTAGGLTFTGLAGSPRYSRRPSPYEWTEEQAAALVARLPAADVLLTHTPPLGVDDEPDDPVHRGFPALRPWVERHAPRWLFHGHTQPHPARRVARLGTTRIVHVRGAAVLELTV
jgi:Icc-related predicted phosphoesterase